MDVSNLTKLHSFKAGDNKFSGAVPAYFLTISSLGMFLYSRDPVLCTFYWLTARVICINCGPFPPTISTIKRPFISMVMTCPVALTSCANTYLQITYWIAMKTILKLCVIVALAVQKVATKHAIRLTESQFFWRFMEANRVMALSEI